MNRVAISIILALQAAPLASADEATAVANLGDALAYTVACPGRLWYDRNVMQAYAEEHKLDFAEGTPDLAKVEARTRATVDVLITRPQADICVEGYRFYGTFGSKVPRFLTRW
jgi:hypothetical protein